MSLCIIYLNLLNRNCVAKEIVDWLHNYLKSEKYEVYIKKK